MNGLWRCRVCEGVNRGGRACATCGALVPRGHPLRTALRTPQPNTMPPAFPPVPPTMTRRQLRNIPALEEIRPVHTDEPATFDNGFDVRPLPGGCLISFGPRRRNH